MKSVYSLLLAVICLLVNEAFAMEMKSNRRRSISDSALVKKVRWAKKLKEVEIVSPHKDHKAFKEMCKNIEKNKKEQINKKQKQKVRLNKKMRRLTIFEVDPNRVDNPKENETLWKKDWHSEEELDEIPTFEIELEVELEVDKKVYKKLFQLTSDKN